MAAARKLAFISTPTFQTTRVEQTVIAGPTSALEAAEKDMNESRDRLMDALLTQHLAERPAGMELRYARAFAALDAADNAAAARGSRSIL